ncbi:hypothetical protein [Kitasatospora atroaurantiaca]|uniref:Integral membrane protein n=1 Tax=Kitasatospora atroaurantiaca TaxID=285545 RepID=A0A561F1A0_9ACTN|nr:hypothetical protein [Kitasatospora atroaurantiaca]TWE21638.1 hypothetical protein FB465_6834 [Kitasatospora atroaurantiaca]
MASSDSGSEPTEPERAQPGEGPPPQDRTPQGDRPGDKPAASPSDGPEKHSAGEPGEAGEAKEPSEVEELRHRIAELESTTPKPVRKHRLRTSGAVVLIILASVLSLLSVISVWTSAIVGDTDRYVATVAPLASNPDVQDAVTARVTTAVLDQIDVKGLVKQLSDAAAEQGVPPRAADLINNLSGPITSGLTELVSTTVHRVVSSSAFETVWINANRAGHSALDKALSGKGGGAVSLNDSQVTIDVGPIVAKVKDELVNAGFGAAAKIPTVHTDFVVFASDDIGKIKGYVRLLEILGNWLPVVTVLIAAAGVFLAVNRRRALIGAALGVAAAMLLIGVLLTVFRSYYLDHLPAGANQAAAAAVYDTLIRFMRASVRAVGALAVITALGAFLIGPSRVAVAVRTACRRAIGAIRDVLFSFGLRLGAVGRFVHRFKQWIGAATLLVAAVVLFTWSYPTAAVVAWITVAVVAAFALREFLDVGPEADSARTPPPGSEDAPPLAG